MYNGELKIFGVIFLALAIIAAGICASEGLFAKPYGLYVQMEGVSMNGSGTSFMHVYAVKQDRRPGPDRVMAVFKDAGQAWWFMRTYPLSPQTEDVRTAGGG